MMSFSDSDLSDDEYEFEDYTNERYKSGSGPPLIAKKARILAATTQNDVETLRELLDSPKWYRVRDNHGNNLLRIAIFRENDEVFDFLRSLGAFQWDTMGDSYAFELSIKRAVDVNVKIDSDGNTFLHCALSRNLIKASRLLIERGADLNAQNEFGRTPLHMCLKMPAVLRDEAVCMLLCHGADPSIRDIWNLYTLFDLMVTTSGWSIATENVFYFTFDELSLYEVPARTLTKLAHKSKSAFKQVTELASDIICTDGIGCYFDLLMTVDSECLLILLEKYPYFVKDVLQGYSEMVSDFETALFQKFDLKNVETLIQSSLSSDMIEIISKVNSSKLIYTCTYIVNKSKKEILEIIYYFLSYGMCLHEIDFQEIYWMTGYNEDFKNLLFMDVEEEPCSPFIEMMPSLIYDLSFDVHKRIGYDHPYGFINWNWEGIFHYFAHPKVQNAYLKFLGGCGPLVKRLPKVPLLQELARDAFRKYFIEIFEIRTAKQFYSLLRALPVSPIHKKIITYESRLY